VLFPHDTTPAHTVVVVVVVCDCEWGFLSQHTPGEKFDTTGRRGIIHLFGTIKEENNRESNDRSHTHTDRGGSNRERSIVLIQQATTTTT